MGTTVKIVLFEPDLLFASKIEAAARRLGVELQVVTELAELLRELGEGRTRELIMSLDSVEGRLSTLGDVVKGSSKVIGYYSHVKDHLADDAKRAGVETVLSRGAFVSKMREILMEFSGKQGRVDSA